MTEPIELLFEPDLMLDASLVLAARLDLVESCLIHFRMTPEEGWARTQWLMNQPDGYKDLVNQMVVELENITVALYGTSEEHNG